MWPGAQFSLFCQRKLDLSRSSGLLGEVRPFDIAPVTRNGGPMAEWLLAPALETLRFQFNEQFPDRNKASDGAIGDDAHRNQGSASDHNPWVVLDGQAWVTALDITHDPDNGVDMNRFTDEMLEATRNGGEYRLKYQIFRALIMDTRPGQRPFEWTPSFEHYGHAHFSVLDTRALLDDQPWDLPMLAGTTKPAEGGFRLRPGAYFGPLTGPVDSHGGATGWERDQVARIQRRLQELGYAPSHEGWADGRFEQETADAVAAWQRDKMPGTTRFGEVWPDDWAILFS
ncbi:peptidoglycan-binding protein [Pseudonocardiaceae bacterium YIM PH 21723]|nr:peptidoglycan-binding protein [Pseudonocardiaceae bacterium YIM PH 21723]